MYAQEKNYYTLIMFWQDRLIHIFYNRDPFFGTVTAQIGKIVNTIIFYFFFGNIDLSWLTI